MKVIYKQKIEDYTVIRFITDAIPDNEATKKKIEAQITPDIPEEEYKKIYTDNLVFCRVGPEAELIDDAAAERLQNELNKLGPRQFLSENGDYLVDNRNFEYWIKKNGEWEKEKITEFAVALPLDAVLDEDLTAEQREEITAQREAARIADMMPVQKENEKRIRIHALAREALNKAEEAELLGEIFDKKAWFQLKKLEIETKYA